MLRLMQDVVAESGRMAEMQLDDVLVSALEVLKETLGWRWSTTAKHAGTLLGAWGRLHHYAAPGTVAQELVDWRLSDHATWRDAMRHISKEAKAEAVKSPVAVSKKQIALLLRRLRARDNNRLHALALLTWLSCARVGDAAQLRSDEVFLDNKGNVDFHFRRGKGVTARGPYTVHSALDPRSDDFRALRAFLDGATGGWLFPSKSELDRKRWGIALREELRQIDPTLEQRSFRRGAIQCLAQDPKVTDETIIRFTGHTNMKMLMRYLNWGAVGAHRAAETRTAALNLLEEYMQDPPRRR